jgi:hypothetical protein
LGRREKRKTQKVRRNEKTRSAFLKEEMTREKRNNTTKC